MRLPDFLILGGMRCGSTTLANILNTQSSIFIPESKELHFFDQRSPTIKSLNDYAEQFSAATDIQLVAEATPDYFSTPGCMQWIHSTMSTAKLIVILRDPIQRAWSHYRFSVATMREIEPFDNALNLEPERLAHPIHEHDIYFSYLQRSRYIQHINHYLSKFAAEQLHVIFLEELNQNPEPVLKALFDFLQLDLQDGWQSAMRITNQASLVNIRDQSQLDQQQKTKLAINRMSARVLNSKLLMLFPRRSRDKLYRKVESAVEASDKLEQATIDRLNNYFSPYNQQLEQFLGRKLPW